MTELFIIIFPTFLAIALWVLGEKKTKLIESQSDIITFLVDQIDDLNKDRLSNIMIPRDNIMDRRFIVSTDFGKKSEEHIRLKHDNGTEETITIRG